MPTLRVGVAQVDITPPAGTHVAGSVGVKRNAEVALDPLYAKAVVFELGQKKLLLVIFDATILTKPITDRVRAAAVKLGFEHDAVMVQATQTHTAPGLGHFILDQDFPNVPPELDFLRGGDPVYDAAVVAKVEPLIRAAVAALVPVKLGIGSGYEGRFAFNRRGIMKDGKACMPWHGSYAPLGPTFVKYAEGPIDPEVGVMALRSDDTRMRSVLVHHTCHPVCVYPKPVISADWCGAVCAELEHAWGAPTFAAVINGACGDVNPWPFYEPGFVPDHKRMGKALADVARNVIESMKFTDISVLEHRVVHVPLRVREVEPAMLKEAEEFLRQYPAPKWMDETQKQVDFKWMQAAGAVSVDLLRRREPVVDYEVQVFRIGDAAIVALPGEPFAIGGLRVKMASPAALTIIAHMATQYIGYLPPREAFAAGGHEVDTSYWAKFTPEALDDVVAAAGEAVRGLWR